VRNLAARTFAGFAQLTVILGLLLFIPAGTLAYSQAWFYLIVFVSSAALITAYLWKNDPVLLRRRVRGGPGAETQPRQNLVQLVASAAFAGELLVPSLDRRFGWSHLPTAAVIAGDLATALGFLGVFFVFRANPYTAATVEVMDGQRVVASGPYAIVRHPMYAAALVMLAGTPVALGSWWGLLALVPMTFAVVWRLLEEERYLERALPGYAAYRRRVRYRLLPFVW
jgi:protein-S-isoprenylcysteine O-methyltransferase Ste14